MTNFTRWKEANGTIHVGPMSGNDVTLCGYALEGACLNEEDTSCKEVFRGKVDCVSCLAIIEYTKGISSRYLKKEQ